MLSEAGFGLVGGSPNPSEILGPKREKRGENGVFVGGCSPNARRGRRTPQVAKSLCLCGVNATARWNDPAGRENGESVSQNALKWSLCSWEQNRLCFRWRSRPNAATGRTRQEPVPLSNHQALVDMETRRGDGQYPCPPAGTCVGSVGLPPGLGGLLRSLHRQLKGADLPDLPCRRHDDDGG